MSGATRLARTIARGTLAQQMSLGVATVAGLVVTTALARSLSLAEFGAYGFVVALANYVYFAIGTAETAALRELAQANDRVQVRAAFSLALVVYAGLGVVAGVVIALGGVALVRVVGFPHQISAQAQLGAAAMGAVTAIGWITKLFQDYQRAQHRFVHASLSEAVGNVVLTFVVVLAVVLDAPLWLLIGLGSGLPLYVGCSAMASNVVSGNWPQLSMRDVAAKEVAQFLRYSGGVFVIASSDVVISSLDRVVVGMLRPPSALGLFEAAAKINGLVRAWVASLSVTLVPVVARMRGAMAEDRERDLISYGTRYMLIATVGPTVALMTLSDRILEVWLGPKFVGAAPAVVVFLAWWLVAPNLAIPATREIVAGRLRKMSVYAWGVALTNLAISIVLTAWLGIVGVALGTTLGYLLWLPYFVSFGFQGTGVRAADLARLAWVPAYGGGICLAVLLMTCRLALPVDHWWVTLGLLVAGVTSYWAWFVLRVATPTERAVLRQAVGAHG